MGYFERERVTGLGFYFKLTAVLHVLTGCGGATDQPVGVGGSQSIAGSATGMARGGAGGMAGFGPSAQVPGNASAAAGTAGRSSPISAGGSLGGSPVYPGSILAGSYSAGVGQSSQVGGTTGSGLESGGIAGMSSTLAQWGGGGAGVGGQASAVTGGNVGLGGRAGAANGGLAGSGAVGISGANNGGSVGIAGSPPAIPPTGGASGVCAGLEGAWTARFALSSWTSPGAIIYPYSPVPASCWLSDKGTEPAFRNDAPGAMGMVLAAAEGKCVAQLYPEYGGTITAALLPTATGLEFAPAAFTTIDWCHPMEWTLARLTLEAGANPTARLEVNVVGACDDMSFTARANWNASLTSSLFPQAVRLKVEPGPICGWQTSSEVPLRILPWHQPLALTALPSTSIQAVHVASQAPAAWPFALSYHEIQSMTNDWSLVITADAPTTGYLQIARTYVAASFEGAGLAALATKGTSGFEQVDNQTTLHLSGAPCTEPIWAAGRLQVAGKQQIVVKVEKTGYDPGGAPVAPRGISVKVIDPNGNAMPTAVWSREGSGNVRVATIPLSGQSEVGVEVDSAIGCTPMEAIVSPDMRIYAIRAE